MNCPWKGCTGFLVGDGAVKRCVKCGRLTQQISAVKRQPRPPARRAPATVKPPPKPRASKPPTVRPLAVHLSRDGGAACGTVRSGMLRLTGNVDAVTCGRCAKVDPPAAQRSTESRKSPAFSSDGSRCDVCGQRDMHWAGCPHTREKAS